MSSVLFSGELPVVALIPGAPLTVITEKPRRGEAIVLLEAENVRPLRVRITGHENGGFYAGSILASKEGGFPDHRSMGTPIDNNEATLGAVPVGSSVTLHLRIYGHREKTETVLMESGPGAQTITVDPGTPLASIDFATSLTKPLRVRVMGYRNAEPFLEVHSTKPSNGFLRVRTEAADRVAIVIEDREANLGLRETSQRLEEGASWKLTSTELVPMPVLAEGQILDPSGNPARNILVSLRSAQMNAEAPADPTVGSAVSDASGRYVVHGLPFDGKRFLIAEGGEWSASQVLTEAAKDLTLHLTPAHQIGWKLKRPVQSSAQMVVVPAGMRPLYALRSRPATEMGQFDDLPPGTYTVFLVDGSKTMAESPAVVAQPPDETLNLVRL
jgi:hypothetical protein